MEVDRNSVYKCKMCGRKENSFERYGEKMFIRLLEMCIECTSATSSIGKLLKLDLATLLAYYLKNRKNMPTYKFCKLTGLTYSNTKNLVRKLKDKKKNGDLADRIDETSLLQLLETIKRIVLHSDKESIRFTQKPYEL